MAIFASTTEKKKIMEKILLAIVLYMKKIEKIEKISQKLPIMILYPKYISDKFLTFFWNIFSFYLKYIYTIWFCAISELLFIFFEIYVSRLFFLYFTSQDRFVSFLEKYPKASCWSRSFFHKKYKLTKIEIKIVRIYLSRALL